MGDVVGSRDQREGKGREGKGREGNINARTGVYGSSLPTMVFNFNFAVFSLSLSLFFFSLQPFRHP